MGQNLHALYVELLDLLCLRQIQLWNSLLRLLLLRRALSLHF